MPPYTHHFKKIFVNINLVNSYTVRFKNFTIDKRADSDFNSIGIGYY